MAELSTFLGGGDFIHFPTTAANNLYIKSATSVLYDQLDAGFWGQLNRAETGEIGTQTICVDNALEQTILSVTGSGTLTHVLTPAPAAAGTITVRITADGALTTIVGTVDGSSDRLLLGAAKPKITAGTSNFSVGYGGGADAAWDTSTGVTVLMSPMQALSLNIGIPFNTSITVTAQLSATMSAGTYGNYANCGYSTFKQFGEY